MQGTPFGRYRLLELLGRGGMGEVWRAHDTVIDRTVAIKMLLPHFADDRTFEQRFRREARAAARLDEPHVVPIYDVGEIDGRLYVAMRLINGQDLQTLLGEGPFEPGRAPACASMTQNCCGFARIPTPTPTPVEPTSLLPSPSRAARARPCSNCARPSMISHFGESVRAPHLLQRSGACRPTAQYRKWNARGR
ncbi:MAG: hypothetical protein QOF66_5650 [Mycobacterium sp.]|nr:serine/threonine protein kinase [Mycobacterium sp.]MDT5057284.1 hypothetical protein [Mycobacterium sp.]